MLIGKHRIEMKIWEFFRAFLYDIPLQNMIDELGAVMSPLRMQGIVDHMYGQYQQTDRETFEKRCSPIFRKIERVHGIPGLDVTPEVFADDAYFFPRFGCGQLRCLCHK